MPKRSWRWKKSFDVSKYKRNGTSVQSLVSTELCDLTEEETLAA